MARTDSRPRLRLDPDARREAILRSAAAAFAERPYAEVTLADVAEGARASTPLVYRYFHGKEDLYAQVVRESVDALMERQARAIDALPDGARLAPALLHAYADHRMATFAALIGLALPGTTLDDVACTAKTLPDFPTLWEAVLAQGAGGAHGRGH